jgi:37-kD nucleoid-associated bacterial protein
MNSYLITEISKIVIHNVGNKLNDDGISFSKKNTPIDNSLKNILISYFISPFKDNEYYNLYHSGDLNLNEVFIYVSKIFEKPNSFLESSNNLAKHLYNCSTHPKIKSGRFYTVLFRNCAIEGETVDAVGLFKSENEDTYLKVKPENEIYEIESDKGINISKLDKGCLIFNTERESGFLVASVDNTSKGSEAIYWKDAFLQLIQRKDNYHNTQNILSLYKNFVTKELPTEFDITKADQANYLNKSIQFFKEKDSFNMKEFTNEVIENPDVIKQFKKYKSSFSDETDTDIKDNFLISEAAVKKQARSFKSVLKLDKNFHIYIHGDKDKIEQGVERDGRKYYKIYYDKES